MDKSKEDLLAVQLASNRKKIQEYMKYITQMEEENVQIEIELEKVSTKKLDFDLNPQQKQAVEEIDSNSIIVACPGSGKTHTLIAKVVYLIKNKDVNPNRIIMITFTKKASQEMNNRLHMKIGNTNLLHIGTIHSLAYRVLQKFDKINYTILDENDTQKCIKKCFDDTVNMYYNNRYTVEELSALSKKTISMNDMLTSMYPKTVDELLGNKLTGKEVVKKALDQYKIFKQNHKYLDFNDLMIRFVDFLKDKRSANFKNSYDYILFDEYQDINSIQDTILQQLNQVCNNLTVVGDDAQAIYSFRGSEVKYIINYHKLYQVKVYRLEMNYRSSPEIVKFCNNIIKNNNSQLDKKMVADKKDHFIKPKITGFKTMDDEIKYIVDKVKENRKCGIKFRDQVVITRTNRQLDSFELHLIKNRISYIKSKGVGLLDRIHVKDFIAYLVVFVNPKSVVHWKRVIGIIEGVGPRTVDKIISVSNSTNLFEVLHNPTKYLDGRTTTLVASLRKLLDQLTILFNEHQLDKMCDLIVDFIKPTVKKNMKIKEQSTFEEKMEDLLTLKKYITTYDSLENFLGDIFLNLNIEEKKNLDLDIDSEDLEDELENGKDYLLLSTIHGAKGLEWDYVYLSGCSSDLVPSVKPSIYIDEIDNIEEERRLFYVGCSRAKKHLEVTLSYDYHFMGSCIYASPFIKEIDSKLYNCSNLVFPKLLKKGDVTHIINNYLLLNSSSPLYPYLKSLKYNYASFYQPYVEQQIYKCRCEMVYGTFIDNLITKIVYQNFNDNIDSIEVPVYSRHGIKPDNHYYNYIDPNNSWKDIINSILRISIVKCRLPIKYMDLYNLLTSKEQMKHYLNIERMVIKIIKQCLKQCKGKKLLPKSLVNLHYNLSFGDIMGEADMLVGRTLIEIKNSTECIATTKYVLQTIFYRTMLRKKGIRVDNIYLINPLLGEMYELKVTPDWKHSFRIFNKVLDL